MLFHVQDLLINKLVKSNGKYIKQSPCEII